MDKEDAVHLYMEYYSVIQNNEIMPFAAIWMGLEITLQTRKSDKGKYHMISLICSIFFNDTNGLIYKIEIDS